VVRAQREDFPALFFCHPSVRPHTILSRKAEFQAFAAAAAPSCVTQPNPWPEVSRHDSSSSSGDTLDVNNSFVIHALVGIETLKRKKEAKSKEWCTKAEEEEERNKSSVFLRQCLKWPPPPATNDGSSGGGSIISQFSQHHITITSYHNHIISQKNNQASMIYVSPLAAASAGLVVKSEESH
jgi:hypothetical protein